MGLQNEVSATDFGYSNVAQCLRLAITAQNVGGSAVVGKLPRGAIVLAGGVQVAEAFTEGTLTLTGQPGDIAVLAGISLATVAFTPIDAGAIMSAEDVTITAAIDVPPPPPEADAARTTSGYADERRPDETDEQRAERLREERAQRSREAPADTAEMQRARANAALRENAPTDDPERSAWAGVRVGAHAAAPALQHEVPGLAFVAILFVPPKSVF